MKFINALLLTLASFNVFSQNTQTPIEVSQIEDKARNRLIPIKLYYPANPEKCSTVSKCPVMFLSAGYGMPHTGYSFLANHFSQLGYLTIAIRHELPNDPPLSVSGNLYETRSENWMRGAKTLEVVRTKLAPDFHRFNFNNITLVGHSNGGDIASWLSNQGKTFISHLITLDHRRVPLPRTSSIKVLSIRASDFPADKGVLPSTEEQKEYASCVVKIEGAKHNDLWDGGAELLKNKILSIIEGYLTEQDCQQFKSI